MNYYKVSIIIPVYNEELYLNDCLNSVYSLDYPKSKVEVIVVDNGSTDRSLDIARSFPALVLERPGAKVGEVRNYGASFATGEYLLFIDGDCVVPHNWITSCLELFNTSGCKVLGGGLYLRENPYWVEKYWILDPTGENSQQNTLAGACIAIEKTVFDKSGGFSETLTAGEDTELSNRFSEMGFAPYISNSINIIHLGFPTGIRDFFRRQSWHASDYCDRFNLIFKDKVFTLTVAYILFVALLIIAIVAGSIAAIPLTISVLAIPFILSIKRIRRASMKRVYFKDISLIYILDTLYIIARSIALISGLAKKLRSKLTSL